MSTGSRLIRAILDAGARSAWRELDPGMLTTGEQPLYRFVNDYYGRFGRLPSLAAVAEQGLVIDEAPEAIGYYVARLRERSVFNAVQEYLPVFNTAMQNRDIAGLGEAVGGMHRVLRQARAQDGATRVADAYSGVIEDYERARGDTGQVRGITFGWEYLDDLTGGACPGDLITVAGRPETGKSYSLLWMALSAWLAGHSVLYVSDEMTVLQSARRLLGMSIGTNPDLIRRGRLSDYGEERLYRAIRMVDELPAFHFLVGNFRRKVSDVDAIVQELAPDLIVIDASYLMHPEKIDPRRPRWETLAAVAEEIKLMATNRSRPVIHSVQLRREQSGSSRRSAPDLDSIAGTDVVGQLSSVVLLLTEGDKPNERCQRRYALKKNREGESDRWFTTHFRFNPFDMTMIACDSMPVADEDGPDEPLEETDVADDAGAF